MALTVLQEDRHILVCVKPAGVLSEEGGMPELLHEQCGGEVRCVHRLDRGVGGVMVYARTREAAAALSRSVAERRLVKEYLAVAEGRSAFSDDELRDLLYHDAAKNKSYVVARPRRGVREAVLRCRTLDVKETDGTALSLLSLLLETGRSHQIRVQLASRSLPLVGDGRYGARIRGEIALWARTLSFPHPATGETLSFSALPPESFPWTLFSENLKQGG